MPLRVIAFDATTTRFQTTQLFDQVFPIQSAKNCLKKVTGRFQRSKKEVRGPEQYS
jgi:hypothetical protein